MTKNLTVNVYSADHGYSTMKTSENVEFPTDIVPEQNGIYGYPKNPLDRIVYASNNRVYFIGNLARTSIEANPNLVSLNRKLERYYFRTEEYKATMLAGIATSYPEAENILVEMFVTGLPSDYWEADKNELSSVLEGEHQFSIEVGETVRKMRVVVKNALVVPQPYGTLCTFVYNDNGEEIRPELLDEYVGVGDFGFYTTDLQLTKDGMTVPGKNASLINPQQTVSQTYKAISERIQRETGKNVPIQTMRQQIEKGKISYYENDTRKTLDITNITDEEFEKTAENVLHQTVALWNQFDIEHFILTGGGSAISQIRNRFKKAFGDALYTPIDIQVNPVFANAIGYKRLGLASN